MYAKREIERLFDWTPPPSTVIELGIGIKKGCYESPGTPPTKRPPSKALNGSKSRPARKHGDAGENRQRSASGSNNNKTGLRGNDSKRNGLFDASAEPMMRRLSLEDEIVEKREMNDVEGGNDLYLKALDLMSESALDDNSTRKKSVFADERIGRQPVSVDGLMKSRKKSEFHPTPKFLTLSYQRGAEEEDGDASYGAIYGKRLYHVEEDKDSKKQEKRKAKSKKKSKSPVTRLKSVNEATESNFDQRPETMAPRRKSVYAQENVKEGPVDVNDLFIRKQSRENCHDKFISISYESTDREGKRAMSGGLYAKKVRR